MADSMFTLSGLIRSLQEKQQKRDAPTPAAGSLPNRETLLQTIASLEQSHQQLWTEHIQALQRLKAAEGRTSPGLEQREQALEELRTQLKDAEAQVADALTKIEAGETQRRRQEEQIALLTERAEALTRALEAVQPPPVANTTPAPVVADSQILLSTLISSSHDAVCVLGAAGNILSWNRAAERMFGYSPRETPQLGAALLIATDSRTSFRKTLESLPPDQTRTLHLQAIRKDGSVFPIELVLARWNEATESTSHFVLIAHDISERQQTEVMRRDKEAAEEANRAKSQFLANMSHELRTPLNAIIGFSEILHDRTFGELTPKQERYVGNILSSGRHLLQLINDILDLSKIEAGRVQLEYAAFSPLAAVRTIDNMVKALLQKKNITLEIEARATLPPLIADQAKFKQVLYNLISNAIKFTPEEGKVTVNLSTDDQGSLLLVDVRDTGIGIRKEDQARIFKEFEQVDNSYSRQQPGTGLGLALVRKFVELHGGTISVESEGEGQGTTFHCAIPFRPPQDPFRPPVKTTSRAAIGVGPLSEEAPHPIALVIGESSRTLEMLTNLLQEHHCDVARAIQPEESAGLISQLKPALILLDLEQAGEAGWTLLAELRGAKPTQAPPVLVVCDREQQEKAEAAGAFMALVQPLEPAVVRKALDLLQEPTRRSPRGRTVRVAA